MSETVPPVEASDDASDDLVWLTHVSVRLALRRLRAGEGRPLLLLHGLGEHTPAELPRSVAAWPGPVWGLDLTGHGRSTIPFGGGYTADRKRPATLAAMLPRTPKNQTHRLRSRPLADNSLIHLACLHSRLIQ